MLAMNTTRMAGWGLERVELLQVDEDSGSGLGEGVAEGDDTPGGLGTGIGRRR